MGGFQSCPVWHNQRPFCQCNAVQVRPVGGPGNTKHSQSVCSHRKAHAGACPSSAMQQQPWKDNTLLNKKEEKATPAQTQQSISCFPADQHPAQAHCPGSGTDPGFWGKKLQLQLKSFSPLPCRDASSFAKSARLPHPGSASSWYSCSSASRYLPGQPAGCMQFPSSCCRQQGLLGPAPNQSCAATNQSQGKKYEQKN